MRSRARERSRAERSSRASRGDTQTERRGRKEEDKGGVGGSLPSAPRCRRRTQRRRQAQAPRPASAAEWCLRDPTRHQRDGQPCLMSTHKPSFCFNQSRCKTMLIRRHSLSVPIETPAEVRGGAAGPQHGRRWLLVPVFALDRSSSKRSCSRSAVLKYT